VAASIGPVPTRPPGSTADEPGPVDQAVLLAIGWSLVAFDRRAGKLIGLASNTEGDQETWTVETWTFDVCTNTWTRMHPDRAPPAQVSGLVYDVDSDVTIGIQYKDWLYPELIGNVWAYDLEAITWTEQGVAPTRETGFFDPVTGLVVAGPVQHDLWSYDVETDTWAPIRQSTPREDRGFGMYVYDASVDRIVEYGGTEDVVEISLFDIRTGTWSRSGAEMADYSMHAWALPASSMTRRRSGPWSPAPTGGVPTTRPRTGGRSSSRSTARTVPAPPRCTTRRTGGSSSSEAGWASPATWWPTTWSSESGPSC
jgi:hypothetical protein